MSAFNLLHLVTKSQPVALRACGLPSGRMGVVVLHLEVPLSEVGVSATVNVTRWFAGLLAVKKAHWSREIFIFIPHSFAGSCRDKKNCKVVFSQQELRKRLTPLQYHVTQEKGTESAFEGEYTYNKAQGMYKCIVCGTALFKSETKFDSNSGWPSFYDVISSDTITFTDDYSYGMHRVETSCSQCGAHLGHIFDDGPHPTGKRYCINSASLSFEPADKEKGGEGSVSLASSQTDKTEQ